MPFVWIGLIFVILKLMEIGPVAQWSWWWVLAPLCVAFAWFEGLEKLLGFDKRKLEHDEYEKRRKERLAEAFAQPKAKRR
jgi:small Trp-rich protein